MIAKPFFGFGRPRISIAAPETSLQGPLKEIHLPEKVTLWLEAPPGGMGHPFPIKHLEVRTGQKIPFLGMDGRSILSTVTGTVMDLSQNTSYTDKPGLALSIQTVQEDRWDAEFEQGVEKPETERALSLLERMPGVPHFASLIKGQAPLDLIVVSAMDTDVPVSTRQYILKHYADPIKEGISILKEITGASRIILIAPTSLAQEARATGAEVHLLEPFYPNALPALVLKKLLGKDIPAGKTSVDLGVGFVSVETVWALASAHTERRAPVHKVVTVVDKNEKPVHVRARIGTPIREVLSALSITPRHGDRIIMGGAFNGRGVYSEDMPVLYDTDAILIQDKENIQSEESLSCLNCGECIRACPANIPVNLLVRFLENGLYRDAADQCDLLSCMECGLCAYVCMAHIPILHHIMLGKYQLALTAHAEGSS